MCGARTEKFMDLCTLLERRQFVNIILGISGYSPPSHSRINKETRENLHIFMPCSIFFPIPLVFIIIIINMGIRMSLRVFHSLLHVQEKVLRTSLRIKWWDESLINKAINPSILSLMF
jgi:hypothetical protein